ncbi:MAG TPA: response regulator transcription factor [Phycisphaeraceae bacterium]
MRLLVIEDNPKMAVAIGKGLEEHGFSVDVSRQGYEAEELAAVESYDAIILDLMLPDRDGVQLCRNLRRRGVQTPVLMLTALSGTQDKINGLEAGADDYLTKPFDFDELVARIRALLRRARQWGDSVLRYADVEMDLARRQVTRAGRPVELTRKEFALLEYFLRNPERVLTRASIGEHVWDMNFDPFSNVIDVYVSMLRRKIDKPFERPLIHTVIGSGYVLADRVPAAR